MEEEHLKVGRIRNGIVIDHIPATKAMRCLAVIAPNYKDSIIIAVNVPSTKLGRKDILKMENVFPTTETLDKISLIAPQATINVIKDSKLVEKRQVKYPKELSDTIICINPKCATRVEKYLAPRYSVESITPLRLKCKYCERSLTEDDVMNQLK
jgi:aspartate carbamoyltransferase regulatory subunit